MDIRTGKRKVPNFHTRRLCRELVELRVSAGLLQSDLFRSTNMSNQTISRIETGQLPGFLELNAMLDLYSVPSCDWKAYQDTWRLAKKVGWWERQGLRDLACIANEHEASRIRELALAYVPLLLQTEAYACELLDTGEPTLSSARLPVELAARMRRQERLDGDKPVQLHALIYEPVLHHGVDEAQLQRLLDRAAQPNMTIQIIPYPDVAYGGLYGPFTLLSFPYKDEPEIAYIPSPVKLIQADRAAQVASLQRIFKGVSRRAMSAEDSLAYMEKLVSRRHLGGDE
jgi:transcriptional regulator with XRE-family HTH domain